ncbi:hypothetical protein BU24DRAFT_461549 [Aaosphaeria arxii CBS 175.79]|uniref:Uncharacterized protein n=1 Tax=Aaosphaeria arxii CBS 175.79 TaxID=1450172 RepID=A0A6A5XPX2_9PLEO|nr:uncharacterized protein BU24DRAFT_461549 [Aaosphaeria arxii CBS 175.79]KAF2015298.1 hypothetical protein BU24DRAFT_461549 [Aaosphaeria arxii CBS 175.79]
MVLQSSDLYRAAPSSTAFQNLQQINQDIGETYLYNRIKLAQILFVCEIVKRIKAGQFGPVTADEDQPWINATCPGSVRIDQQENAVEAYDTFGKLGAKAVRPFMKDSVDEGCRPALFAATSDDILRAKTQGAYIVPDRKVADPSKKSKDGKIFLNL